VMLAAELRGEPYNKTQHRRQLQRILTSRNDGSIEMKHQNISAVLLELGYPYINGYKPLRNKKTSLQSVVLDRLAGATDVRGAAEHLVEATASKPVLSDILAILVPPPIPRKKRNTLREKRTAVLPLVDYAERDQKNRSLGNAGEEVVMDFEHARLWKAGRKELAEQVERISTSRGDHVGYDIHSFEEDGAPRLIEVKTTRLSAMTPFYASRNEVRFSDENRQEYHLYRLYRFEKETQLFVLSGSLKDTCSLDPINYLASIA